MVSIFLTITTIAVMLVMTIYYDEELANRVFINMIKGLIELFDKIKEIIAKRRSIN